MRFHKVKFLHSLPSFPLLIPSSPTARGLGELTVHSSPRSSNGLLLRSWRATVRWTGSFQITQSAYRQGHSTETALLKIFSDILDAADSAQVTLLGLLDLSTTQVVRCRRNSACMDFIIYPRSTAISHFQWSLINTDPTEIRRATGFDNHLAKGLSLSSVHASGIHSPWYPQLIFSTNILFQTQTHLFKLHSLPRLFPISLDCLPGFWFLLFSFYALSNDT